MHVSVFSLGAGSQLGPSVNAGGNKIRFYVEDYGINNPNTLKESKENRSPWMSSIGIMS
jgi:hypothetical protein